MEGCDGVGWGVGIGGLAEVRGEERGFPLAVEGNTACGEAGMKEAVCVSHLFLPLVNKGF